MEMLANDNWLAVVFVMLMGIAIMIYVILDGYDLGVGILMSRATDAEKDKMIASIGPFWDANETWLVLAVGLLLVAFPQANGIILGELYMPVAVLLAGLIVRGVAFDFRAKVHADHKHFWDKAFCAGSILAATTQGYMLGLYIVGFERTPLTITFCILTAICLAAGYSFIGSAWLIMKTEKALQKKAILWARRTLLGCAVGLAAVSIASPWVSPRIFEKWFSFPNIVLLFPIPMFTAFVLLVTELVLRKLPRDEDRWCWVPFAGAVGMIFLGFYGLAYSFFPYIVPDKMTIWEAASAPESLKFILWGVAFVLPAILGYTVFVYRVFWGKVGKLEYY